MNVPPQPDNQRRELHQNLWSQAPRCECCSGSKYNCTAGDPCKHCTAFFDYVDTYIAAQVRESQIDQHNRTSEMYVYENAKRERKRLSAKEKL